MKAYLRKTIYNILTFLMDREKLIFLLCNKEERVLLGFKKSGYLYDIGWTRSIITENIVDLSNNPVPWVTYPFIQFISEKKLADLEIFEFGSGNSTLFYANKAAHVSSVEHNKFWYDKIKSTMPLNVELSYCELGDGDEYSNYAMRTGKLYDMIIVDGSERVKCCLNNIGALKSTGIVVLDDTELKNWDEAVAFLKGKGFKKLDFWGTAPNVYYLRCTSIFYRPDNCLDI
jgi:hypothetical protein